MKNLFIILTLVFITLSTTAGVARKSIVLYSKTGLTATATSGVTTLNSNQGKYYSMKLALTVSNNSGTTPTADVKVQSSADCINYTDVKVFTQVTTVDSYQTYAVSDNTTAFDTCWRVVSTLAGTTPNYDIKVELYHD